MNLSQLAKSDARREEAQYRERHHAALIAAIVCRIWQDRTRIGPSVRQRPPPFSNITETEAWHDFRFRAEERKGAESPLPHCVHCGLQASQWVHVPWGNCSSPSPSHEEGVALFAARTCNEVVPAHKEFLRARQTPVPLICIVSWVLACTVPGTRYMLHLEREARDWSTYNEYSYRIILLLLYVYCTR